MGASVWSQMAFGAVFIRRVFERVKGLCRLLVVAWQRRSAEPRQPAGWRLSGRLYLGR